MTGGPHANLAGYLQRTYLPDKTVDEVEARITSSPEYFSAALKTAWQDGGYDTPQDKFVDEYIKNYGNPFGDDQASTTATPDQSIALTGSGEDQPVNTSPILGALSLVAKSMGLLHGKVESPVTPQIEARAKTQNEAAAKIRVASQEFAPKDVSLIHPSADNPSAWEEPPGWYWDEVQGKLIQDTEADRSKFLAADKREPTKTELTDQQKRHAELLRSYNPEPWDMVLMDTETMEPTVLANMKEAIDFWQDHGVETDQEKLDQLLKDNPAEYIRTRDRNADIINKYLPLDYFKKTHPLEASSMGYDIDPHDLQMWQDAGGYNLNKSVVGHTINAFLSQSVESTAHMGESAEALMFHGALSRDSKEFKEMVAKQDKELFKDAGVYGYLDDNGKEVVRSALRGQLTEGEYTKYAEMSGSHLPDFSEVGSNWLYDNVGQKIQAQLGSSVIKEWSRNTFKLDPDQMKGVGGRLWTDVTQTAGGLLPLMALGAIGKLVVGGLAGTTAAARFLMQYAPSASAAVGAAMMNGAALYDEAGQFGADEDTRFKAFLAGAGSGLVMGIPIGGMFKSLSKVTGRPGSSFLSAFIKQLPSNYAKGGASMAGAFGVFTILNDLTANQLYDFSREVISDKTLRESAVGFLLGGFLHGTSKSFREAAKISEKPDVYTEWAMKYDKLQGELLEGGAKPMAPKKTVAVPVPAKEVKSPEEPNKEPERPAAEPNESLVDQIVEIDGEPMRVLMDAKSESVVVQSEKGGDFMTIPRAKVLEAMKTEVPKESPKPEPDVKAEETKEAEVLSEQKVIETPEPKPTTKKPTTKPKPDDTQNVEGVQGGERVGKEPVERQPDEGASRKKAEADRVLQTPEEPVAPGAKEEVAPFEASNKVQVREVDGTPTAYRKATGKPYVDQNHPMAKTALREYAKARMKEAGAKGSTKTKPAKTAEPAAKKAGKLVRIEEPKPIEAKTEAPEAKLTDRAPAQGDRVLHERSEWTVSSIKDKKARLSSRENRGLFEEVPLSDLKGKVIEGEGKPVTKAEPKAKTKEARPESKPEVKPEEPKPEKLPDDLTGHKFKVGSTEFTVLKKNANGEWDVKGSPGNVKGISYSREQIERFSEQPKETPKKKKSGVGMEDIDAIIKDADELSPLKKAKKNLDEQIAKQKERLRNPGIISDWQSDAKEHAALIDAVVNWGKELTKAGVKSFAEFVKGLAVSVKDSFTRQALRDLWRGVGGTVTPKDVKDLFVGEQKYYTSEEVDAVTSNIRSAATVIRGTKATGKAMQSEFAAKVADALAPLEGRLSTFKTKVLVNKALGVDVRKAKEVDKFLDYVKERVQDANQKLFDAEFKRLETLAHPSKTQTRSKAGILKGKVGEEAMATMKSLRKGLDMSHDEIGDRIIEIQTKDALEPGADLKALSAEMDGLMIAHLAKNGDLLSIHLAIEHAKDVLHSGRSQLRADLEVEAQRKKALQDEAVDAYTGGKGIKTQFDASRLKKLKNRWLNRWLDKIHEFVDRSEALRTLLDKIDRGPRGKKGAYDSWSDRKVYRRVAESRKKQNDLNLLREEEMKLKRRAIYGSRRALRKAINDNQRPHDLGEFVDASGETQRMTFSQNQAAQIYEMMRSPERDAEFDAMNWTPEMKQAVKDFLTPEVREFSDWKVNEFYPEIYKQANEVFKRLNHIDLPFHENYAPIVREHVKEGYAPQPLGGYSGNIAVVTHSALKARRGSKAPFDLTADADAVLMRHVMKMNHYIAFAETISDMNSIFQSKSVRAALQQNNQAKIVDILDGFWRDIANEGASYEKTFDMIDKWRGRMMTSSLAIAPTLLYKQFSSAPAYASDVPLGQWIKELSGFMLNPVKYMTQAYKTLMPSSYMRERYKSGFDRDMVISMARDSAKRFKGRGTLASILMTNVKIGDAGAILIGGYAHYKVNYKAAIKNGMSKAEAHEHAMYEFEEATKLTQQSANIEDMSSFQRAGSFAKAFTMYQTSPFSYFRQENKGFRDLYRAYKTKDKALAANAVKRIAIFHFVMPTVFQYAAQGFPGLLTSWDDEDERMLGRAAKLGSINGIFLIGNIVEYASDRAMGKWWAQSNQFNPTAAFEPVANFAASMSDLFSTWTKYPEQFHHDLFEYLKDVGTSGAELFLGLPARRVEKLIKNANLIQERANSDDENFTVGEKIALYSGYPESVVAGDSKTNAIDRARTAWNRIQDARKWQKAGEYTDEELQETGEKYFNRILDAVNKMRKSGMSDEEIFGERDTPGALQEAGVSKGVIKQLEDGAFSEITPLTPEEDEE